MSSSEDWDVEQYKTEHECDEHWELRRNFLITHKDKFPEDSLICLAQVFTNIELLGCRYPQETMTLIADLTKDVAKDFREKQKSKLKRTFVRASDAASNKAKGLNPTSSTTSPSQEIPIYANFIKSSAKEEEEEEEESVEKNSKLNKSPPFGDIVIVEHPGESPQSILACTANMMGINLAWKFDKSEENTFKCTITLDGKELSEIWAANRKLAKKEASVLGLKELQKHYYTIRIKPRSNEEANVTTTTLSTKSVQDEVSDDNVGKKLMKLMGWTGGGLGKSQQGIVEPVALKQQIRRKGLGLKSEKKNAMHDLKQKTRNIFKKYLTDGMKTDLIFATDFTNEERATIHQIARQMNLKSHSYGPKNARTLVVSRKVDMRDLLVELKNLGGSTDKHELVEPTKEE